MPSGCARIASASTTASSGSTLSPGWRSRSAPAASANAAHSMPVSPPWLAVSSAATAGWARRVSSARALKITTVSPAVAARPSSEERSAHGVGNGAGRVPLYWRARPRPARPPRAPASPASISQRAAAMRQATAMAATVRRPGGRRYGARATSWHPAGPA